MFRRSLNYELKWFALHIAAIMIFGALTGHSKEILIIGLLFYIAWLFYNVRQLENWVWVTRRKGLPPTNALRGIWGEIAEDIVLLSKKNEKDKLRLKAIVSRAQQMAATIPDGVVLLDSNTNIEWWNEAGKTLLDLHDSDLGHKFTNIVRHPKFINYFESGDHDEPLPMKSVRRYDQYLEFQVHSFGEQGDKLLIVRDITRVYKLEQMRKDFVANVSHELRTPLTVIQGYLETLEDSELRREWHGPITQMQQQSQRMSVLVADLITLTKLETDDRDIRQEKVELTPLLEEIIEDARSFSTQQNHIFELLGEEDLILVGNENEIQSAISNLVFNAVKYNPQGCTISVSIAVNETDLIICIHDDGIGIEAKHLPRLTERFYRVDESRSSSAGGTGLGLAIVKHVLHRHDAELKISSHVGSGTTFSCHFPKQRLAHTVD